jgi:hypothetical protein
MTASTTALAGVRPAAVPAALGDVVHRARCAMAGVKKYQVRVLFATVSASDQADQEKNKWVRLDRLERPGMLWPNFTEKQERIGEDYGDMMHIA